MIASTRPVAVRVLAMCVPLMSVPLAVHGQTRRPEPVWAAPQASSKGLAPAPCSRQQWQRDEAGFAYQAVTLDGRSQRRYADPLRVAAARQVGLYLAALGLPGPSDYDSEEKFLAADERIQLRRLCRALCTVDWQAAVRRGTRDCVVQAFCAASSSDEPPAGGAGSSFGTVEANLPRPNGADTAGTATRFQRLAERGVADCLICALNHVPVAFGPQWGRGGEIQLPPANEVSASVAAPLPKPTPASDCPLVAADDLVRRAVCDAMIAVMNRHAQSADRAAAERLTRLMQAGVEDAIVSVANRSGTLDSGRRATQEPHGWHNCRRS